jgi:hypothetical protein
LRCCVSLTFNDLGKRFKQNTKIFYDVIVRGLIGKWAKKLVILSRHNQSSELPLKIFIILELLSVIV